MAEFTARLQELKAQYGFVFQDGLMEKALNKAREEVLLYGYEFIQKDFTSPQDTFELTNFIGDVDWDELVTTADIEIFEFDDKPPYTVTDLKANITDLVLDHPSEKSYLIMDAEYPTSTNLNLRITYYRMMESFAKRGSLIGELEEMYFIRYLFVRLDPYKLQQGMTNKKINGQTITYNVLAIKEYVKKLNLQINSKITEIRGYNYSRESNVTQDVVISKGYDSINPVGLTGGAIYNRRI